MFGLRPEHIVLIVIVALLIFGPKQLPELGKSLGKAINEFRNVIDYFPDAIDAGHAQYSIGVCQTQTGDAEEAVKSFEKVITNWPTNDFGAYARSEVCKIYWRLGKPEKWAPHMEFLATGSYTDPQNLRNSAQHRYLMHLLVANRLADGLALVQGARKSEGLVTFASWTADSLHAHHIPTYYGEKGAKIRTTIANAFPDVASPSPMVRRAISPDGMAIGWLFCTHSTTRSPSVGAGRPA